MAWLRAVAARKYKYLRLPAACGAGREWKGQRLKYSKYLVRRASAGAVAVHLVVPLVRLRGPGIQEKLQDDGCGTGINRLGAC